MGLFHQPRFSGIQARQVTGRTHRDGRSSPWRIAFAEDTVEEQVARVMVERLAVCGSAAGADTSSLQEIAELLEADWLPAAALVWWVLFRTRWGLGLRAVGEAPDTAFASGRNPGRIRYRALFAAGLWGTVVRPAAYEVRGELVARAAPDVILVRHQPVSALGMGAMEMMAVQAAPQTLDAAALAPGDRVRLAVRPSGDALVLVWIERIP